MLTSALFTTPEDCARGFYEAFARGDLDELMATWAEDEDICCVHPGAAPIYGFQAVRSAWSAIFRNNAKMRLDLRDERWTSTIAMANQYVLEWLYVGDDPNPRAPLFVTNSFIRTPHGWRMISHHASPIHAGIPATTEGVMLH